jgi:hypothetical protein
MVQLGDWVIRDTRNVGLAESSALMAFLAFVRRFPSFEGSGEPGCR